MSKIAGKITAKFSNGVPAYQLLGAEDGEVLVAGHGCGNLDFVAKILVRMGVKVILAKSFSTTFHNTVINYGIVPLVVDDETYKELSVGDPLHLPYLDQELTSSTTRTVTVEVKGKKYNLFHYLQPTERAIVLAGGLENYEKK